eukprot:3731894-Amphidinium_carterae.1
MMQAMQVEIRELRQAQSNRSHSGQHPHQGDITRTHVSLHRALPCYSPEVSCRQADVEQAQQRSQHTTPSVDSAHGHHTRVDIDNDHDMLGMGVASAWTFNDPHGDMTSHHQLGSAPGFRTPSAHSGTR